MFSKDHAYGARVLPHTALKRFDDRDFCGNAPYILNELPDNIKASESVQNFKTH